MTVSAEVTICVPSPTRRGFQRTYVTSQSRQSAATDFPFQVFTTSQRCQLAGEYTKYTSALRQQRQLARPGLNFTSTLGRKFMRLGALASIKINDGTILTEK